MQTDKQVLADVFDVLKRYPFIFAPCIDVSVKNGMVMLSGQIDCFINMIEVEKLVMKIAGVCTVILNIKPKPSDKEKGYTEIAQTILQSLNEVNEAGIHSRIRR